MALIGFSACLFSTYFLIDCDPFFSFPLLHFLDHTICIEKKVNCYDVFIYFVRKTIEFFLRYTQNIPIIKIYNIYFYN